ncbi:MAG: glutathione S-transferase N-terminal domain-containing protein [Pseudomonadota bacterium]|nr:glutathione S-transferase N-terminal domain-containing protein [Pseudomonadota bacterium]
MSDSPILSESEQRHAGVVLYAHPDQHLSHRVRLALAEKNVAYRLILVDPTQRPEDLLDLNPYASLPTLVDKELRLYHSMIILEYLEERYHQTRLLPDHPASRAEYRQYAWRIEQDWLQLANTLLMHPDSLDPTAAKQARHELRNSLISLSPLFAKRPFFMSDQFGLCDCMLAPMLWRLAEMRIELPSSLAAPLLAYCQRLFTRPAFLATLTEQERQARHLPRMP